MYILREEKNVWLGETQSKEVGFFTAENVKEVPVSELTEGARTTCVAMKINLCVISSMYDLSSNLKQISLIECFFWCYKTIKGSLVGVQTNPLRVELLFYVNAFFVRIN